MRQQLLDRRLLSLEDCRVAWEGALDPLAVCVAVTKVPEMPGWLVDALLALLYSPSTLKTGWAAQHRDDKDARRTWELVSARTHPDGHKLVEGGITLEMAKELASHLAHTQRGEQKRPTEDAIWASYKRVRRGLKENPGRYYAADAKTFNERLQAAGISVARLMTALIETKSKSGNKRSAT